MKRIPLLTGLIGSLSALAHAQSAIDLAPVTINDENIAEPTGLNLEQQPSSASHLGLTLRETPASIAVANRADIERRGAQNFQDAANALPGVNASAPPGFGGFISYRGFTSSGWSAYPGLGS